jgi:hypothetical protein
MLYAARKQVSELTKRNELNVDILTPSLPTLSWPLGPPV